MKKQTYWIEVCKAIDGTWYWRLMCSNGNEMCGAGDYNTKGSAKRAARATKRAFALADLT